MKIDSKAAERILRAEADTGAGPIDKAWAEKVERLSKLCEDGVSKTHVAFLGTEMLAKAVDARADLVAIKPKLAPDNPNAYSARSLCHGVLVPLSAELGFSLGVTGREPLNNQPYFRMSRLGDDTPVHSGGRAAFDYMTNSCTRACGSELGAGSSGTSCLHIGAPKVSAQLLGCRCDDFLVHPDRLLGAIKALVYMD